MYILLFYNTRLRRFIPFAFNVKISEEKNVDVKETIGNSITFINKQNPYHNKQTIKVPDITNCKAFKTRKQKSEIYTQHQTINKYDKQQRTTTTILQFFI